MTAALFQRFRSGLPRFKHRPIKGVEVASFVEGGSVLRSSDGRSFRMKVIHCPTCGPKAPLTTIGLRGDTRIVACDRCGLIFPNPFPIPESPPELGEVQKAHPSSPEERIRTYRALIRGLLGRIEVERPWLLEVGSRRGEVLCAAREEGLSQVVGLELNSAWAADARRRYQVDVREERVEALADRGDERFEIIVLNDVLQRAQDPDAVLRACARLLEDGGILFVNLPHERNLRADAALRVSRWMGRPTVPYLSPTFPPFDVFGFPPSALQTLLEKHGLLLEQLELRRRMGERGGLGVSPLRRAQGLVREFSSQLGQTPRLLAWARRPSAA